MWSLISIIPVLKNNPTFIEGIKSNPTLLLLLRMVAGKPVGDLTC